MWLAERAGVAIISADSRQVYRGFDIGTAKPTVEERARVPHYGVDVVEPTHRYSAAQWSASADAWIDDARAGGRQALVVGGTGLYLRALFHGFFTQPELDLDRRRALEHVLAGMERDELRRWVAQLDPERVHLGRTQLLRAVEVALLTGRRVSALHREHARPARWRAHYLLVDPGAGLAGRITTRLDAMFDRGWADEVEALMRTVPDDAPAWKATGYRQVRMMVRGERTRAEARESIVIETRQYAKRQRTWFRHQLPAQRVTRFDPQAADWRDVVDRWWRECSTVGPLRDKRA